MDKNDVLQMMDEREVLIDLTAQKIREINHYKRQVKKQMTALAIVYDLMTACNPNVECEELQNAICCNDNQLIYAMTHKPARLIEKMTVKQSQRAVKDNAW